MFDKLDDLLRRYEELMNELSEPDVTNDTNRFRKLMKEHKCGYGMENKFNGYWDEPLDWMKEEFVKIFGANTIYDLEWMPLSMKEHYLRDCSAIFGGVYSIAVNTYHLKDLHDCEKFLATLDNANNNSREENDLFKVERDTESNRINLYFDGKPEYSVISALKHRGFRWSPSHMCWTRQLTDEAESSLAKLKQDLGL